MQEGRMRFDPRMYEELEIVQERSIGSEMTYKNSLLDTETAKSTAKNGNSLTNEENRGSKKHLFMKTANFGSEKPLLTHAVGGNEEKTYRETILRLEERISSKNQLISQLKTYQIQLTDAFEKVKNENQDLKARLKSQSMKSPPNSQGSSKDKLSRQTHPNDYEMLARELETILKKCNSLSSANEKLQSEKEFLKSKLDSSKEEVEFLSNQLLSSGTGQIKEGTMPMNPETKKLKERIKALENENSKLKIALKSPSSEFSSQRVSHGPDDFSNTKSLRRHDFNTQKNKKFSDACCNLMVNCFPKDFDHEKPSLKQVWRWIKGVLEDFVTLNKVFGELQEMLGANTVADVMFTVEKLTE